jgi:hypothetical protein
MLCSLCTGLLPALQKISEPKMQPSSSGSTVLVFVAFSMEKLAYPRLGDN